VQTRYKLLVTDIDGTLFDKDGKISDVDLDAVQQIYKSGMMISLSTGRAACGCLKILDKMRIEGFHIFFDGALVTSSDLKEDIYVQPLDKNLLRPVCNLAKYHGLTLELFSQTQFFVDELTPLADLHSRLMNFQPLEVELEEACRRERIIMGCLVTPASEVRRVLSLLSGLETSLSYTPTTHPACPDIRFINITMAGISKGTALKSLMDHLGLERDEVVAIGDGANDISLFSNSGLGIAMGNAHEELKRVANYITEDVEHNGVARAISHFFG
jgi:Cof subfamily protein (haloacid dehalogenase superfamily)